MPPVHWCLLAKLFPVEANAERISSHLDHTCSLHFLFSLLVVVYSRVAGIPHFRSKCKHSTRWTNEQSDGKCVFLGWTDGVTYGACFRKLARWEPMSWLAPWSLSSPYWTSHFEKFNRQIEHITTFDQKRFLNVMKQSRHVSADFEFLYSITHTHTRTHARMHARMHTNA